MTARPAFVIRCSTNQMSSATTVMLANALVATGGDISARSAVGLTRHSGRRAAVGPLRLDGWHYPRRGRPRRPRRDDPRVLILLARSKETGARVTVPTTALVQAIRLCARRAGQQVATSDPDDLRKLDPRIGLVIV